MREVCGGAHTAIAGFFRITYSHCFLILYVGLDQVDEVLPIVDDSPLG